MSLDGLFGDVSVSENRQPHTPTTQQCTHTSVHTEKIDDLTYNSTTNNCTRDSDEGYLCEFRTIYMYLRKHLIRQW